MMERLAQLADRRAKTILILAVILFVAAGALGAGAAKRLDPFGADDPATESVIADQQLQQAGYRDTDVVVLLRGVDARALHGRVRIAAMARRLRSDREVAS